MKHASSRELFRYWTTLRGERPAPAREEIDPAALRRVLGDSFILSFEPASGHMIRLAGTRVCALFCREMKATSFLRLWAHESRGLMTSLVDVVTAELTAVVAGAHGQTHSEPPVPLELLMLPLAPRATHPGGLIGVLAPLEPAYWIGSHPVKTLSLGAFRHIAAETAAVFLPRTPIPAHPGNPMRPPPRHNRPRLVVHEGGAAAKSSRSDLSLSDR